MWILYPSVTDPQQKSQMTRPRSVSKLTILHVCCHTLLLEKLGVICINPLGEDNWKLVLLLS